MLGSCITALALNACGADPAVEERAPGAAVPARAPEEATAQPIPVTALVPAELAWMRERTAHDAVPSPLVLPPSFFVEDPRYRGLVPNAPLGVVVETWSQMRDLEHQYDVSFRSADRAGYLRATADLLRGIGRTMPAPRDNGVLDLVGEPQVSVIPIVLDQESVRVVAWFRDAASRDRFAAFVAALPEISVLRQVFGLESEPRLAQLLVTGGEHWRAEVAWSLDGATAERLTRALAERGYTESRGYSEDDPTSYWRREDMPAVTAMVTPVEDGFDLCIVVRHPPDPLVHDPAR
jgi:hypothetical protein